MTDDMKRIESRIDDLEQALGEIKETLNKAFEREQGQWKSVFDAVDMNFKEIRDYANDTFLHADTFWEYRKKDNDLN
jgi:chromosome segregation ATPase|tara:strand:+ start:3801 stop:4031 length:231 start_codon:yes stop_codon:yes gene_type:complete